MPGTPGRATPSLRHTQHHGALLTKEPGGKALIVCGKLFRQPGPALLRARATRYRRERWTTPSGETVSGALPACIVGGFGPDLQRFILALHFQGQVTTDRLTALLNGMGVVISKRQVVRLLAKGAQIFADEDAQDLRAGLASAAWVISVGQLQQ